MTTTHVRTIGELVEAGILGALAFEFMMLMADLGYSTSSASVLIDSAPAPAKNMAEMFAPCTGHSGRSNPSLNRPEEQ